MSDLTVKFTTLETQLTTQHGELIEGINSILAALGAPPPGPTTTLGDIAEQLTGISNQLTAIQSANASFYTGLLDVVGLISTNLETLSNNNSLNSARILQAIYTTACACPVPTIMNPPPLDVTPTSLEDQAKCRRIQFYLHLFGAWLTSIANYGSSAGSITGDTVNVLLASVTTAAGIVATGVEIGSAAGIPGAVVAAIVGLIIAAILTLGGSVLIDYANQYNSPEVQHDLLTALFAVDTADEGHAAFEAVIGEHFAGIPGGIINALLWTQWTNDIYSGSPVVDDSAFDGTICVPDLPDITTCTTFSSHPYVLEGSGTFHVVTSAPVYPGNPIFTAGDFFNWSVRLVTFGGGTDIRVDYYDLGNAYHPGITMGAVDATSTYPEHTTGIGIHTNMVNVGAPFSIELCPPA